ncbi:MAG: response regulator transcription factor [Candidatus Dormibacteria bacterium]|jgi:DNA-binding NarL/FixJ family response regulator
MNIAPLRVIIVDDSGEVLSALGRIIDKQPDMELLGVASSVDDGVLLARQVQPDVVVLDVNMPDGGGLRAAKELVVVVPGARLIAFSAFDKMLIRRAMTVAGVSAYVSKSGDIRELLAAIRAGRDVEAFTTR